MLKKIALVLSVATAAVIGGTLVAQADGTDTVVACRNASFSVRLINSTESCLSTEQRVEWSVTGPAGPTGATGPAGPVATPHTTEVVVDGSTASSGTLEVTATCPTGTVVTGGGMRVWTYNASTGVFTEGGAFDLIHSQNNGSNGWTVKAVDRNPNSITTIERVDATAECLSLS